MVDKRVNKSTKRDKPTITKKALERLVTINNGGPINNIKRSGSEEPEFAPSSTLTSRPKDSTPVTTVKPAIQKPNFDFKALMSQGGIGSQLPGFLEQMRAANEDLEAERQAGTLARRKIEIDDTSSEGETSSEEEDSDDDEGMEEGGEDREGKVKEKKGKEKNRTEKKEKKERGQYIEMNLGLGVLEEKNSEDETSSSGSSDDDSDEDMGVMDKLEGRDKEEIEARKKAKIEVVKET